MVGILTPMSNLTLVYTGPGPIVTVEGLQVEFLALLLFLFFSKHNNVDDSLLITLPPALTKI